MKRAPGLTLFLAAIALGWMPLSAANGLGHPTEFIPTSGPSYSAADEAQDARDIADKINEAVNLRRNVSIVLHNEMTVSVALRVSAQRYWLIVPGPDGSETWFRASMIAAVKIK